MSVFTSVKKLRNTIPDSLEKLLKTSILHEMCFTHVKTLHTRVHCFPIPFSSRTPDDMHTRYRHPQQTSWLLIAKRTKEFSWRFTHFKRYPLPITFTLGMFAVVSFSTVIRFSDFSYLSLVPSQSSTSSYTVNFLWTIPNVKWKKKMHRTYRFILAQMTDNIRAFSTRLRGEVELQRLSVQGAQWGMHTSVIQYEKYN